MQVLNLAILLAEVLVGSLGGKASVAHSLQR